MTTLARNRNPGRKTSGRGALSAALVLAGASVIVAACAGSQNGGRRLLTTVSQVRALPALEAERGYPVRLSGIATYHHPGSKTLIVQAGDEGIFVDTAKTQ